MKKGKNDKTTYSPLTQRLKIPKHLSGLFDKNTTFLNVKARSCPDSYKVLVNESDNSNYVHKYCNINFLPFIKPAKRSLKLEKVPQRELMTLDSKIILQTPEKPKKEKYRFQNFDKSDNHLIFINSPIKFDLNNYNTINTKNVDVVYQYPQLTKEKKNKNSQSVRYNYLAKSQKNDSAYGRVNQDKYFISNNILEIRNYSVFAVFDGHGPDGQLVSNFVNKFVLDYLSRSELFYIPRSTSKLIAGLSSLKKYLDSKDIYAKVSKDNHQLIKNMFSSVEEELKMSEIDASFSGCTACVVMLIGDRLICANVGDSRAILVKESKNNRSKLSITELSIDHKPENFRERARILKRGGIVKKKEHFGVELGPDRIWVESMKYPGLAMSRSLGDEVAKTVGVISEPEFIESTIDHQTKFLVVASDGLWELLSNQRVAEIVNGFYSNNDIEGCVNALIDESSNKWIEKHNTVDDITVIVTFFNNED